MLMTRFKRGDLSKRVGALLCALALVLHLAFVPLRARAFAGVLPAVAAGTVVTAFLMSSGIYPYEEQKEFAEYVSDNLSALWSQYLDWRIEQSMNPPVTGNELSGLTGYLTQGVITISRNVWNTLSEFTSWIISHFSVVDNQMGVELGITSDGGAVLPTLAGSSYASVVSDGLFFGNGAGDYAGMNAMYAGSSLGTAVVYAVATSGFCTVYVWGREPIAGTFAYTSSRFGNTTSSWSQTVPAHIEIDGVDYTFYGVNGYLFQVESSEAISQIFSHIFSSRLEAMRAFLGLQGNSFAGVTADTTTVSPPSALPSDTPWAGLAVEGVGTVATVGGVEQVIQHGVTDREKPEVKVVEVELGAGTDVDTETGEVTESPIVIAPDTVIPAVSELTAPQAFLDTLQSAMQTKFPFCLPFDVMRILSALSRQPQAPLIKLTFHDNFSDADYTIEVDLSPWNSVAAIVREMQSILLLLGFWLNFDKFNVLNIILGQLG